MANLALLRGGKILVYGAAPADVTIPVSPFEIYSRELTIVSSYAGTYDTFSKAIDLIASKRLDPTPILTNHFEFADMLKGQQRILRLFGKEKGEKRILGLLETLIFLLGRK